MAISEQQFAAEIVDAQRQVFKFDDIGCMIRFAQERNWGPGEPVAYFVKDFHSRRWLRAPEATYVRSSRLHTPMVSGVVAVENRAQAEALARDEQGTVVEFGELWKLDLRPPISQSPAAADQPHQ